MEFKEVLARRRMVRNHLPDPIDPAVLERIGMAGLSAPSAGHSQGQSIVLVTDEARRAHIAELAGEQEYVDRGFDPWLSTAPAHLIICASPDRYFERYDAPDKEAASDPRSDWDVPYWWIDAGATFMAILLAAVDEGLSAGFLGAHAIPGLAEAIGLPEHQHAIGVATIGKAAPDRRSGSLDRGDRPRSEVLHWQRWGGTDR
jgi:nitroreductase